MLRPARGDTCTLRPGRPDVQSGVEPGFWGLMGTP